MSGCYDDIADQYVAMVDVARSDPDSILEVAVRTLLDVIGDVAGLSICDVGCGEGFLTRRLGGQEDCSVVGVDISKRLLQTARERTSCEHIRYVLDDAQKLESQPDGAFDLIVSNFSLMDIPDLKSTYAAALRVLRSPGRMAFSVTHPCFQMPHRPVVGSATENMGEAPIRYHTEGFWRSDNVEGVRGRVGAYHRTLSTYLNDLTEVGLIIKSLREPSAALRKRESALVPSILVILAEKGSGG